MCKEQTASIRTPNRSVGWFYVRFCILNGLQTIPASVCISFVQKFRGSGRADVSSRSSVSFLTENKEKATSHCKLKIKVFEMSGQP